MKNRRPEPPYRHIVSVGAIFLGLWLSLCLPAVRAFAARIILKSGMELEGDVGKLSTMVAGPTADSGDDSGKTIVFVDDGLRRTYTSLYMVKKVEDNTGESQQKINVPQPVAEGGRLVAALGQYAEKPTELDQWGRRRIKIILPDGPADIVQGVTLVTPRYYELRTLNVGQRLLLDQRYATSNLPSQQLAPILEYAVRNEKPEARLNVVQLYLQAGRYGDAQRELESLQKSAPNLEGLAATLQDLRQTEARTALRELRLRSDAGQHRLVRGSLEHFPTEGVAGETLFQVRELIQKYVEADQQIATLKKELQDRLGRVSDTSTQNQLRPIIDEICADLAFNNVARLSAYRRLADDPKLSETEKLALAISGWLVGTNDATDNLAAATSLSEVRNAIRKYLNEPLKTRRGRLIDDLHSQQAASPQMVAKLLAAMKPCVATPEPATGVGGFYELTVPGRDKEPDTTYYVQLPPEYDPYRRYPAILTLHGLASDATKQVDWWAGSPVDDRQHPGQKQRMGQAMRRGYIVIAPQWAKDAQQQYQYSAREHIVVLDVLRDACRRFSIDTDRVFLSGHAMGGDAAWDMGLAHPDLWAGIIPVAAMSDSNKFNYCQLYWNNGRYVPMYFVGGQLDGAKMAKNAPLYDRYLRSTRFDATVVEFIGRGQESFSDEILRIFDWTGQHQRNFFPKEFECATIRSFDNYFWWVEINRFPAGLMVDPEDWPGRSRRTLKVNASIRATDSGTMVRAATGRGATTIWLAPELVNFSKRIRVSIGGRDVAGPHPDIEVMLEDVRSRGDRQHPFWARVDFP